MNETLTKFRQAVADSTDLQEKVKAGADLVALGKENGFEFTQEELEAGDAAASTAEAELSNLSTSDLNRRFNNTFLYLVGKLYTNINIDTFAAAADLLQKEFRILLSRSPLPIDSKRLVQIMALNMFVIDDTKYGQQFILHQVIFTI